jgi:hypothetical protein
MKLPCHFRFNLIASALLVILSTPALADDNYDDMSDISLSDLFTIEVTSASKIATPIAKAPAVITAYTQQYMGEYSPTGAFADFYLSGMWAFLDTQASDVFVRAQLTSMLDDRATLLAGFDGDRFSYDGDNKH